MTEGKAKPISVKTALETILDAIAPMESSELPLTHALGYVLAEDITATDDVPFVDNSGMDGYAVIADDLASASPAHPIRLRLAGDLIAAGRADARAAVAHGTTVKIMTGAMTPAGATSVVPIELVTVEGEEIVFTEPAPEGQHIRRAGEDIAAGQTVLRRGAELTPAALAVAVAAGRAKALVVRRPLVAVFTSGDELVSPGEPVAPGLVRNSNSLCIAAMVRACGCDVVDLGIARDSKLAIREGLLLARKVDALVTSGGMSVGDRDLMRGVLEEEGLKVKFWRINMKPGKPVLFGLLDGKPVFGLPGNPVSSHVTFELFVRPALRRMMGHVGLFRPIVPVTLGWELRRSPGRPEFIRVKLARDGRTFTALPTTPRQGSAITSSLLDADGLVIVDEETVFAPKGSDLSCVMLWGREEEEPLL